jgi:predicted MFS family arabinose efflux permease
MTVDHEQREHSGLLSSLSNPGLRRIYGSEMVSGAGDGVFWVALVVFLSDQPHFGVWLTLAVIARLAPRAVLSLSAGSMVDRSDLRVLIVATELVRAALMLALAALVAADVSALPVLLVVLASYTVAVPTRPALSAIVPSVAGERHLAGANAVLSTIRQVMTFVGPLLGVVVVAVSPQAGFVVNAATFTVSGLVLAGLRGVRSAEHETGGTTVRLGLMSSAVDGVRVVRSVAALPALVALIGIMYVVRGAEMVLHVYVVRDQLDVSVDAIGLLGGAIGLGAVVAMPIAVRAAGSRSPVRPILASIVLTALPTVALAVITRTFWACLVLVFVGIGMVVFEVVIVVMVQRVSPPDSLGRVFGAINGAANTGKLVGAVVAPVLVAVFDLDAALVIVALVVLVVGVAATRPLVVIGRVADERKRSLAPTVRVLRGLAIFDGASQQSLERIAAEVGEFAVGEGSVVIRQGDEADDLFLVVDGSLRVTVGDREVGRLVDGEWFGEIGLLDRRPRTATVTATADTRLWRIPGSTFLSVLEDAGAPPSALVESIADRLSTHR